jgi:hypothetical protein
VLPVNSDLVARRPAKKKDDPEDADLLPAGPGCLPGAPQADQRAQGRFGAEPICRVLSQHGCRIAPSTYYDAALRAPSARAVRDEQLKAAICRIHKDNYGVYGGPEGLAQLNRDGTPAARCTVERLIGS